MRLSTNFQSSSPALSHPKTRRSRLEWCWRSLPCLLAVWLVISLINGVVAEDGSVTASLDAKSWIHQGDSLLKQRELDGAIDAFSKAIDLDPSNPKPFYSRATCYLAQRRQTPALRDLNSVLDLDSLFHPARYQRSKILGERGSFEDAIRDLKQYKDARPTDEEASQLHDSFVHASAWATEGEKLAEAGKHDDAIAILKDVITVAPGDAMSRLHIVRSYLFQNDVNQAHAHLFRLVNVYPEPPVYLLLATIQLLYFNEYERSRKTIKVALESDPENKTCKKFFKSSKKLQKRIEEVERMIKSLQLIEAMDLTVDRNNEDSILAMSGKMSEERVELFGQEFKVEDSGIEAKAYSMACHCVATLKQKDEKYRACARAVELLPEDPETLLNAAQVAITRDEPDKALEHLKDVEKNIDESDPSNKKLKKQYSKLSEEAHQAKRRVKVKDYYGILGVEKEATDRQIKKAHGKMAVKYHPDRASKTGITIEEAEKKMIEINEAYEVLKDPEQRAKYDRGELHEDQGSNAFYGFQGGGFDPNIMRMFQNFGGGGGRRRGGGQEQFFEFSF